MPQFFENVDFDLLNEQQNILYEIHNKPTTTKEEQEAIDVLENFLYEFKDYCVTKLGYSPKLVWGPQDEEE